MRNLYNSNYLQTTAHGIDCEQTKGNVGYRKR